ncbi:YncE family protein [Spongiimicrobium salis]|uniref:YncE family protein n=1 Tax=Spongiimicrobium salis TaxID=1667022 RepID=UPI00374CBF1C
MKKKSSFLPIILIVVFGLLLVLQACSSEDGQEPTINVPDTPSGDEDTPSDRDEGDSLASNGCQNVVIYNGYAYAACGSEIEVISLESMARNLLTISADDITVDESTGQLFTQSGRTLRSFNLDNPMEPAVVATTQTSFSIFSGISAANGIVAVSGGSTNSDTQVYTYTANSITLVNDGIPVVDNITGNPDVHVAATANGGATAFYSQDLGNVANWGIQMVAFDANAQVIATPEVVVLTPGAYRGTFDAPVGPANFPLESEFLDNRLYVAHFAAPGIHVIDLNNSNALSLISLPYEPINIGTDGSQLFVIGLNSTVIDVLDPTTGSIVSSIQAPLRQPNGVAVSASHIAIADRSEGLLVVNR